MSTKKILVINDAGGNHARPFEDLSFEISHDHQLLFRRPQEIAFVLFTGGQDVSPELYGAARYHNVFCSSKRDEEEVVLFNQAVEHKIPFVGICRGAQFLCVMAGGRLIQDVSAHRMTTHQVRAYYPGKKFETLEVTGDHHQMQYPWDLPHKHYDLLAWSPRPYSAHYAFGPDNVIKLEDAPPELKTEPDVVWYSKIKALAIQFHPEWMDQKCPAVTYIKELVNHFIIPIVNQNEKANQNRRKAVTAAG